MPRTVADVIPTDRYTDVKPKKLVILGRNFRQFIQLE